MIETDYVCLMARYNAWQNKQLRQIFMQMDPAALVVERGAFFGSVLGTLNHILWGDTVWMSRFCKDVDKPALFIPESPEFTPTVEVWGAERVRMDDKIRSWAEGLSNTELRGETSWFSGATHQQVTQPLAVCVVHMFNHQTHHRGQISQMLSAIGISPAVSDLVFMPKDA